MRLISISQAADMLQVHPNTLKNNESADGRWCKVYGCRLHVYKVSDSAKAQRRYDADEIEKALNRLQLTGRQEG